VPSNSFLGAMYKYTYLLTYLFTSSPKQMPENGSINGDANLPQSATKLTKTCSSEFGGLLWHHMIPQRKTILVHNYSPSHEYSPKDILENLLTV